MQYECFGRVAAGFIGRMRFLHSVPFELLISAFFEFKDSAYPT
jgi:hypothetical protein